ncbi:hypothetical protein PROFUN_09854 [Planoprotostelium fungivorum]|uniref:Uncharacterized protein n=1 Tax=Planoprotostelium fungivorum TaxID=1890364 RepID=A0A2P6NFM6_9EUKA|nr:hypothetical protein PROFUN_09854 [Planoprotostelium fungivorum]
MASWTLCFQFFSRARSNELFNYPLDLSVTKVEFLSEILSLRIVSSTSQGNNFTLTVLTPQQKMTDPNLPTVRTRINGLALTLAEDLGSDDETLTTFINASMKYWPLRPKQLQYQRLSNQTITSVSLLFLYNTLPPVNMSFMMIVMERELGSQDLRDKFTPLQFDALHHVSCLSRSVSLDNYPLFIGRDAARHQQDTLPRGKQKGRNLVLQFLNQLQHWTSLYGKRRGKLSQLIRYTTI